MALGEVDYELLRGVGYEENLNRSVVDERESKECDLDNVGRRGAEIRFGCPQAILHDGGQADNRICHRHSAVLLVGGSKRWGCNG